MSEWITGKTPPPNQKPDKCYCTKVGMLDGRPIPHSHLEDDGESYPIRPDLPKPDTTLRDSSTTHTQDLPAYSVNTNKAGRSLETEIIDKLYDVYRHKRRPRTATRDILDLLAKRLPELEKLKKGDPYLESKVSYNQAILEVRAIIDGKDL